MSPIDVILHPVRYEELQYVNAILLIPYPELLQSDPDKKNVAILWTEFGKNFENATVKLISLHSNVSLKTTYTKRMLNFAFTT